MRGIGFMAAVAMVITAVPAAAQPAPPGTAVPDASAPGWEWSSRWDALWLANVAGGRGTGGVYNSLGTAALAADFGALTGGAWPGGRAEIGALWIRGGSVSGQYAGDALVASNLDGFDSIRLFQAFVEQSFAGDRASLRVGATNADAEFLSNEYGGTLSNSGFGWPAFVAANVPAGGSIYPTAGLGVRLQVQPPGGWTLRAAVYDGDPSDDPDGSPIKTQHGTHWQLNGEQGAFAIAEAGRTFGEHATTLRAGAWMHTGAFDDTYVDASGESWATTAADPAVHRGNHGAYAVAAKQVWAKPGDDAPNAALWLRGGVAPADRNAVSWAFDGGVTWTGPFPDRPADVLSAGFVQAQVSRGVVANVRDERAAAGTAAGPLPDFERVFEMTYRAKVHPRVSIGPDIEWVQHPGFSTARRDAWIVGLRIGVE